MKRLLTTDQIDRVLECPIIARSPHAPLVGVLVGDAERLQGALHEALAKEAITKELPTYTDDVVAVMRDTITAQRARLIQLETLLARMRSAAPSMRLDPGHALWGELEVGP